MHARYRISGKFVSAQKAERLSHFKKYQGKISTDIIEKKGGKSFLNVDGFASGISLRTIYAMEKDRRTKEEERERRRSREKERTLDFQRRQIESEPRVTRFEPPAYDEGTGAGGYYAPPQGEDEDEYLPDLRRIPYEDELIDDYFENAIDIADIDGDIYIDD